MNISNESFQISYFFRSYRGFFFNERYHYIKKFTIPKNTLTYWNGDLIFCDLSNQFLPVSKLGFCCSITIEWMHRQRKCSIPLNYMSFTFHVNNSQTHYIISNKINIIIWKKVDSNVSLEEPQLYWPEVCRIKE